MKQYRVMTLKDRVFGGKFDPAKLEAGLNSFASEGWELKAAATADIHAFGGNRQEMIMILERDAE